MYSKFYFFLFFVFGYSVCIGQNALDIDFNIKNYRGETLLLAYNYGDKTYIHDTINVLNGKAEISRKEELEGGLYLVVANSTTLFEIILSKGDQKFIIDVDLADVENSKKVKGSEENKIWFDYLLFLSELQKKKQIMSDAGEDIASLDVLLTEKQRKIIAEHPNSFTSKLILSFVMPDLPEHLDKYGQYYYYMKRYFDNFDFTDSRFVRTYILHNKCFEYLELTVNHPDSIMQSVDYILNKAMQNKDVYRYCLIAILNHYAKSKIVCMDKVYVHVAEKYYCNPVAPFLKPDWIEQYELSKICDNAGRLKPLLCEVKAPNLKLNDFNGVPQELHSFNSKYIALIFWNVDISDEEITALKTKYLKVKDLSAGVQFVGVCSGAQATRKANASKYEWISKAWLNLEDTYNVAKNLYVIQTNLVIYLIDKDKKIVAKHIGIEQIGDVVNADN